MDVAAFKGSHSVGTDVDTTTLRAARARSSSMGAHAWVRFGAKLTTPCHDTPPNSEHTSGALVERSGQGQKASTPQKPDSSRR